MITDIISLMRIRQWVKNLFVFAPAFFSGHIFEAKYLFPSILIFVIYCFLSSAIYCWNDVRDVEKDKLHAVKCDRPIASGRISVKCAFLISFVLLFLSAVCLSLADFVGKYCLICCVAVYLLINVFYSLFLKSIPLVDVFVISFGYVLRIVSGGGGAGIWISQWIVMMTFLLALFLAFGKRRDDAVVYEREGVILRESVKGYGLRFVDVSMSIIASVTMVCYVMYCMSDEVMRNYQSDYVYTTAIWVIFGLLRYSQIVLREEGGGDPVYVFLRDKSIFICALGWLVNFAWIIYG